MAKILPLLCHHLNCWIETTEALRQCQDLLQDRHQQLALVKEAQAMGRNHALYSVVNRYNSFKRARDAHEKAKAGLKDKIEECEKQINMHNVSLKRLTKCFKLKASLIFVYLFYLDRVGCSTRTPIGTVAGGIGKLDESRGPRGV